jgi:hypothetical protein
LKIQTDGSAENVVLLNVEYTGIVQLLKITSAITVMIMLNGEMKIEEEYGDMSW